MSAHVCTTWDGCGRLWDVIEVAPALFAPAWRDATRDYATTVVHSVAAAVAWVRLCGAHADRFESVRQARASGIARGARIRAIGDA